MNKQIFNKLFKTAKPIQDRTEMWNLVQMLNKIEIKKVLEVGLEFGGSARIWSELGDIFVGVDLHVWTTGDFSEKSNKSIHLINGNSSDSHIIEQVRKFAPFDFIFLDADHGYQSVKSDINNYFSMLRNGGICGIHDVGNMKLNSEPFRAIKDNIDNNLMSGGFHNKRNPPDSWGIYWVIK